MCGRTSQTIYLKCWLDTYIKYIKAKLNYSHFWILNKFPYQLFLMKSCVNVVQCDCSLSKKFRFPLYMILHINQFPFIKKKQDICRRCLTLFIKEKSSKLEFEVIPRRQKYKVCYGSQKYKYQENITGLLNVAAVGKLRMNFACLVQAIQVICIQSNQLATIDYSSNVSTID